MRPAVRAKDDRRWLIGFRLEKEHFELSDIEILIIVLGSHFYHLETRLPQGFCDFGIGDGAGASDAGPFRGEHIDLLLVALLVLCALQVDCREVQLGCRQRSRVLRDNEPSNDVQHMHGGVRVYRRRVPEDRYRPGVDVHDQRSGAEPPRACEHDVLRVFKPHAFREVEEPQPGEPAPLFPRRPNEGDDGLRLRVAAGRPGHFPQAHARHVVPDLLRRGVDERLPIRAEARVHRAVVAVARDPRPGDRVLILRLLAGGQIQRGPPRVVVQQAEPPRLLAEPDAHEAGVVGRPLHLANRDALRRSLDGVHALGLQVEYEGLRGQHVGHCLSPVLFIFEGVPRRALLGIVRAVFRRGGVEEVRALGGIWLGDVGHS
mmetsp:Transcript_33259/g.80753  ORF Transcript_33259/g.80753 Transcript_33259/m.80753 type:complete len:374 (+) Transcript_33259:888-2009(+)